MYICVCNNVTERHIRTAVAQGASTMTDLQDRLKVSTCCGKCRPQAEAILASCLAPAALPSLAPCGPMTDLLPSPC